jgi:hypothetical protein
VFVQFEFEMFANEFVGFGRKSERALRWVQVEEFGLHDWQACVVRQVHAGKAEMPLQ